MQGFEFEMLSEDHKEHSVPSKLVETCLLCIYDLLISFLHPSQEYLEDQKYKDEEGLAEKLEGLKSE